MANISVSATNCYSHTDTHTLMMIIIIITVTHTNYALKCTTVIILKVNILCNLKRMQ